MTQTAVVKVAVEQTAFHFDKLYSYRVTPDLTELVTGCRVLVPFGKGNRFRQGIIMEMEHVASEQAEKLKPVMAVLDEQPLLNDELMMLTQWMKERTFCTVFDAVRAMLPTGLYWNVKPIYRPIQPLSEQEKQAMTSEEAVLYALACTMLVRSPDGIAGDKLLDCAGLIGADKLPERMVKKGWFTRGEDASRRTGDATRRMARLAVPPEELETAMRERRVSPKQRSVLVLLEEVGTASVKELCYLAGVTGAVLSALEKKQLVECYEQEVLRSPFSALSPRPDVIALNAEQQLA